MGNLSTYRASGLPVGSVTMMHKQTQQSLIIDNGAEFLRTGEYVPYQAKYDKAVALGFYSTSGGGLYNPASGYCIPAGWDASGTSSLANKTLMYAKGKLGYLISTESVGLTQGAGQEFLFSGIVGDAELNSPVNIKAPSYENINLPKPIIRANTPLNANVYYRTVSQPTWYDAGSTWISVVIAGSSTGGLTANNYYDLYLFSSRDGTNWSSKGILHTIETAAATSWVSHISAAAVGNVLNVFWGTTTTVYTINVGSWELDSLCNVSGAIRAPIAGLSHATANASDNFNFSIAPLSPTTGYLAYLTNDVAAGEFKLFDITTVDAWATTGTAGSLSVATTYVQPAMPFIMSSNGTSLVVYSNANPTPQLLRVTSVNNVRSFQITDITQAATPSYAPALYWSGNYYVLVANDATTGTSGSVRRLSGDTSTLTLLSNLTPSDTNGATWLSARVEGTQLFKNHVIYVTGTTNWTVGNLTTNVTTDFAPFAVSGGVRTASDTLNSIIMANGSNVLLARGGDGTNILATISKYDLVTPNIAPDLKYVSPTVNGPVHSNGEFKRLTDPGSTIVYIPRNTGANTFLYSSDNGDTWTTSAIFSGINGINDIEYISGRYVVAGNANASLNYAHSTSLGGAWTTGFINTTVTNVLRIFNTGTALIAFNSVGMQQRSTTGTAWVACSGTQLNAQCTYVKSGSTNYVFTAGATSRVNRHQSTDDGVTWSAATTLPTIVTSGLIPNRFTFYNSKWYCVLSVPTTNVTTGDVYETSDLANFTEVLRSFPIESTGKAMSGPIVYNGAVYSINQSRDVFLRAYENNYPVNGFVISRLAGGGTSFVGCSEEVLGNNTVGYLRIK